MPIDPGPSTADLIQIAVGVGSMALCGLGGVALLRRASRRRRQQIEAAGEARPAVDTGKRKLALEEIEPDVEAEAEEPGLDEPGAAEDGGEEAGRIGTMPEAAAAPLPEPPPAAKQIPPPAEKPSPGRPPVARPPSGGAEVIPFPAPKPAAPPAAPAPKPARAEPVARPVAPTAERPIAVPVDKPASAVPAKLLRKRDAKALAPGLARTRSGWVSKIGQLFAGKKEIDPNLVGELEKVLLTADIGVRTSAQLLGEIRSGLSKKEIADPDAVWAFLRRRSAEILALGARPVDFASAAPFVLLVIGVNGSGKTTTIGKLAAQLTGAGRKVVLAAGDTFRAAATEQLEIWANRVGASLVRGKEGADPSSVIFEAVRTAKAEGFDVVIADTAGRLHTKTELMDELGKVRRVIAKAAQGAPHETWLVIDSTQGQNAIAQAQVFTQAMQVTGIVLTKLDGTAKGGVILGIADQLGIPVRYVGIGERVEDLREFDAEEFVEALYERA